MSSTAASLAAAVHPGPPRPTPTVSQIRRPHFFTAGRGLFRSSIPATATVASPPKRSTIRTCTTSSNTTVPPLDDEDIPSSSSSSSPSSPADRAKANALVDRMLDLIKDTDSGDQISAEHRLEVDTILNRLETIGATTPLRPLNNPYLFGNFNVAYVSAGNQQNGAPAGGRFRSGDGKLLFRTAGLFQSVLQPDVVTNKIKARLFGCLPLSVGLRGTLVSIPQTPEGPNTLDTVKVFFEQPELTLPAGISTRFGPPSSVVLTTTYVDERIRLGKGSRGSLFVFTRGGEAENVEMDQVGLRRTTPLGAVLIFTVCAALVCSGGSVVFNSSSPVPVKGVGLFAMLLGTALSSVFLRGGVMDGREYDRPDEVQVKSGGVAPA